MGLFDKVKSVVKKTVTGKNVFKGTPLEAAARVAGKAGRVATTKVADAYTGGEFSKRGGFDTIVAAGKAAYGDTSALKKAASSAVKNEIGGINVLGVSGEAATIAGELGKSTLKTQQQKKSATPAGKAASTAANNAYGGMGASPSSSGGGFLTNLIRALFGG